MEQPLDNQSTWYTIRNVEEIDSPALVVYPARIRENIRRLKSMVDSVDSLRPHVKTHKMAEVTQLLLAEGIRKFKCATIAEAEMLAQAGAPDVLLAYQPVGPKIQRLAALVKAFPGTRFSCLIDHMEAAMGISMAFEGQTPLSVFIDLNVGMNRTGISPGGEALDLYMACEKLPGITPIGLHAYDGHIRDTDLAQRKAACDQAFEPVAALALKIAELGRSSPAIVAGGSPTFLIHAQRAGVERSPGTFIFWDWGYEHLLPDLPFLFAALVITRVISVIDEQTLCLDLGHKSVAAENPLPRVKFLNAPDAEPLLQSEEHLVVKVPSSALYPIGDVFYGVPIHICPTCALYEQAQVVENKRADTTWKVIARDRSIHF
jgi:D-serine deaminase-like pyridoxal phosphate-dependent protein